MGDAYWLGLGPITKREWKEARKYNKSHKLPNSDKALRHTVARLRKRREINRYLKGKEEAATDPSNPWQIIYGDCLVGGIITFVHTSGSLAQPHKYLHLIITLCAHELYLIRAVYFDDYQLTWDTDLLTRPTAVVNATGIFAGLVKMQINYGEDSQAALSQPVGDTGDASTPVASKWTTDHRQRGHCHVYLRLEASSTVFKNGQPDITFRVTGKNDMIDPRDSSAAPGASNAAIVLYDYMTNARWGLGADPSEFESTRLSQACDDCEDAISLAGGGTESRYLINAHFGSDSTPGTVVEEMLSTMAGDMPFTAGQFSVYAGKARPGPVMTITEQMILSEITMLTKVPRADNFNAVRATFVSRPNEFEESDVPVVKNSTWIGEDGETIYEDLTFGMVNAPAMAQRLMKIALEETRQGITFEFLGRLDVYQAEPGEWVEVTYSRFGWTEKLFKVVRSQLVVEEDPAGSPFFAVRMQIRETAETVYDWDTGDETEVDPAPNTDLPSSFE